MSRIPGIRRFLHIQRGGASVARAVDDELLFHFDMTMRELMANGMTPDQARAEAERRFGDVERTRARLTTIDRSLAVRDRRAEWWSAFAQDFRYALRGIRLKPWFAIAVILTLGLGIGANATMFGIVDRLLFRPPNFLIAPDRASRLYLTRSFRDETTPQSGMGYRRYLDLKEGTTSFDAMTPYYANNLAVGAGEATKEMRVGVGAADLWKMFDIKPVIGRFFTAEEDLPPTGTRVAVLSYSFWQTQFGGRNDAVGSMLDIGPEKFTVIGVAPEGFNGFDTGPVVAFIPVTAQSGFGFASGSKVPWYTTYNMTWFNTFVRRKLGTSAQAASADLDHAYQQSYKKQADANPKTTPLNVAKPHAFAGPVLHDRGPNEGNEAKVATWLIGVAAMVLLIACANVANLLLARALKRRREVAVRIALGVSRSRLLMQLVTESLMLAVLGGVAGVIIAQTGGGVLRRVLLDQTDTGPTAFTDPRLLIFSATLAIGAGLLTGLAPVFQTGRGDVAAALKAGSREGTVHRSRLRVGLLVAQAALSVVLLVGAGLFLRSLSNVQNVRMGYDVDRLLWIEPVGRGVKRDSAENVALRNQLLERAQSLPSVERATRALTVPFWSSWSFELFVAGIDSVDRLGDFTLQGGTPGFFETMGTRILRGRAFTSEDREHTPLVIVVGESMAKKLWPNEDAIGKCIRVNADTMPCTTVIGIAEDVRRGSMNETALHYYLPVDQFQRNGGGLFIRTRGPAAAKADEVRRALQPLMAGTSYVTVTPMSTIIASEIRSWKMGATMFSIFGALALVLAAVGLYSVIAYNVTQRTHEMGVRVALGAQSQDVIRLIVREGLQIVLPGVALGAIIALLAGKWVAPLLFNVSP
ncbi:MAG TPA: ABC transporter permease, partial [Gemmatimonadaceae bacterium]|nr:ABC transporter permease [Gemmatimonadaceae bacterium]